MNVMCTQQFCFQVDSLVKTNYYWYDTKGVTYNCISTTAKLAAIPNQFSVSNYPNPFNISTSISFSLPISSEVSLIIYNLLGQKVKTVTNDWFEAGYHTLTWDGTNEFGSVVASGIYFYKLRAGDNVVIKKMSLLK